MRALAVSVVALSKQIGRELLKNMPPQKLTQKQILGTKRDWAQTSLRIEEQQKPAAPPIKRSRLTGDNKNSSTQLYTDVFAAARQVQQKIGTFNDMRSFPASLNSQIEGLFTER